MVPEPILSISFLCIVGKCPFWHGNDERNMPDIKPIWPVKLVIMTSMAFTQKFFFFHLKDLYLEFWPIVQSVRTPQIYYLYVGGASGGREAEGSYGHRVGWLSVTGWGGSPRAHEQAFRHHEEGVSVQGGVDRRGAGACFFGSIPCGH